MKNANLILKNRTLVEKPKHTSYQPYYLIFFTEVGWVFKCFTFLKGENFFTKRKRQRKSGAAHRQYL